MYDLEAIGAPSVLTLRKSRDEDEEEEIFFSSSSKEEEISSSFFWYLFSAVVNGSGKGSGIFFPEPKERLSWCEECAKTALIKKVQRPSHSVCLRSGVGFFRAESVQCASSSWSSFVSCTESRKRKTPVWEGMRTGR